MKGMTLENLSNMGVSEQQQSRYERGINRINIDSFIITLRYLKLILWLFLFQF